MTSFPSGDLDALLIESIEQSKDIWRDVGLSEKQQEDIIEKLHEKVVLLIKTLPKEENEIREQYLSEITQGIAECKALVEILEEATEEIPVSEKLGEKIDSEQFQTGKLTSKVLEHLRSEISSREVLVESRQKAIVEQCSDIRTLFNDLGMENLTELDKMIMEGGSQIGCTNKIIQAISSRRQELLSIKENRIEELRTLCRSLDKLWKQLKVPAVESQAFLQNLNGYTASVIQSCENEKIRLESLRAEQIVPLILELRESIKKQQQTMYYGPNSCVSPILQICENDFTESILSQHEELDCILREKRKNMDHILKDMNKLESAFTAKKEYEAQQKDSSRLVGRAPGAAARLKREEKMRARIKRIPEILSRVEAAVKLWEKENPKIMFHDRPYLEIIEERRMANVLRTRTNNQNRKRKSERTYR
eukprot:g4054.t1